jgi:hypothetical protein
MSGRRYVAMFVAVSALVLVSAACGSKSDIGGGGTTGGGTSGTGGVTITVKDFEFDPSTVRVPRPVPPDTDDRDPEGRLTSRPDASTG